MNNTEKEPIARDRTYQERIDELADFIVGKQAIKEPSELETATAASDAE